MCDNDWKWEAVVVNVWEWFEMCEDCCNCVRMAGIGRELLEIYVNGRNYDSNLTNLLIQLAEQLDSRAVGGKKLQP